MTDYLTKEEVLRMLKAVDIVTNDTICLQVQASFVSKVLGGMQTIIESCMELLSQNGCMIVPTFTLNCLDPVITKQYPWEDWKLIRKEMHGYKPSLSLSSPFANQFLKYEEVQRSKHPVYSFAYWGGYRKTCLDWMGDYPISFEEGLMDKDVKSVLLGETCENSYLLYAVAKQAGLGTTFLQRAKVQRVKTSVFKTFFQLSLNAEEKQKCLSLCQKKSYIWKDCTIYSLSLNKMD